MYIIPQFFTNVLKNKLEIAFSQFENNFINDVVSCLTNPNDYNKYVTIIAKVQEEVRKLIINAIKDMLEALDEEYKNSSNRLKFYTINKSNVERTITTIFDDVSFKRTYYESRLDNSLHFILDETLRLPKYDRYDQIVKGMAINTYSKTNLNLAGKIVGEQLTSIACLANNDSIKTIPRQSIYNWIKDWKEPIIKFEQRETPKILYVMADEKFIGCQDQDNDIMIKSFVAFEGIEQESKGRNKLKNKTIINLVSTKPWEDFSDILFQMYDSQKIEKKYLIGDGAKWIKLGITELKMESTMEIKHLLCYFHFKQAINHISSDKDDREILNLYFKENSKKEFKDIVNEIKNNNSNRKDIIEKKEKYILNNYNAIKDMMNSNIGSSMESHISHFVANQFGSRPKGYSTKNIQSYLNISNYYNNGLNIFNIYIQSFNNDESVVIDEEKINFSIFENTKSSNLQIIQDGKKTPLYDALYNIAHPVSI